MEAISPRAVSRLLLLDSSSFRSHESQTKSTTWNTLLAPYVRLSSDLRILTTNTMEMSTAIFITRRVLPQNARAAVVRS